ncbi:hypothetical protein Igag_1689 [Ignisphaera aggregans DSM 17230]|uniref:Uncharacterized protein n=1 Tax=Ignisphaera aggregans (strain DSM 17230 / JCM 13409 / AQ1.S1) TaxID=583356 RepID=E0SRV5_IGNAA|nr:hypothetical protein Igag_1689 [Ignisphaera aggregans DSM 17230]
MRGQSDIIISIIAFSMILMVVLPLAYTLYTKIYTSYQQPAVEENRKSVAELGRFVAEGTLNVSAIYLPTSTDISIVVRNIGGRQIDISRVFIAITCRDRYYMVTPREFNNIYIASGETISRNIDITKYIDCTQYNVNGVYVVTSDGYIVSAKIYNPQEEYQSPGSGSETPSIPQYSPGVVAPQLLPTAINPSGNTWNITQLLGKGFRIATVDNMNMPTKIIFIPDPNEILYKKGMVGRNSYVWVSVGNLTSTTIQISNQYVRNIYLGYDKTPDKYIIILTGDGSIRINGVTYCGSWQDIGFRVRIYGFRNSTRDGIMQVSGTTYSGWINSPDQNVARYVFLGYTSSGTLRTLNGVADRVEILCRRRTSSGETGYYPYITMFSNKPTGNMLGILFTTIDRRWGDESSTDEGVAELQDGSSMPIAFVYMGNDLVIDNTVSGVSILITYAFHDNSGDDYNDASYDGVVMVVGIADENGNIIGYRSFTFRELTRYEDTYPPVAQIQNAVIFIPIPKNSSSKRFYPFIAFQDPYRWSGTKDDLDISLYIDSFSVILYR